MEIDQTRLAALDVVVSAVHHVLIAEDQFRKQMAQDPQWTVLTLDYLAGLGADLYLVDLRVSDLGAAKVLLDYISQDGQAPYLEQYFFGESQSPIVVEPAYLGLSTDITSAGHVRFYLHYFDPNSEIEAGELRFKVPLPTPAPEWLMACMPYDPPN